MKEVKKGKKKTRKINRRSHSPKKHKIKTRSQMKKTKQFKNKKRRSHRRNQNKRKKSTEILMKCSTKQKALFRSLMNRKPKGKL